MKGGGYMKLNLMLYLFIGGAFGKWYLLLTTRWLEHLNCGFQAHIEQILFEIYLPLLFAHR